MISSQKVILVILDGLNFDVAKTYMGFLQAMCHAGKGRLYHLECELPSMSRPLYECILTGATPIQSGIYHNNIKRLSQEKSIFHYAMEANLKTAAAAYYWISELYNSTPFNPRKHRHTEDSTMPIQYGHFYYEDHYPDSHLFADAEHLRTIYQPDFLLIHSMNIDDAGHKEGLNSVTYRNMARQADYYLSDLLNDWLNEGYQVIITSDHGMSDDKSHGGLAKEERDVPFFVFGQAFSFQETEINQTDICGIVCTMLGIIHDKKYNQEILA